MSDSTLTTAVATELVTKLPTTKTLDVIADADTTVAGTSIAATFIAAATYDVVLRIIDDTVFAGAGESVSVTDLVHNAIEEAVGLLGNGVLSNVKLDNDTTLLDDPDTAVVTLAAGGAPAAVFGLRVRATSTASVSASDLNSRLGRINNVEMALTVEIGRTRMPVRDVLGLEPGAIVELDRSAGAPADILLNGRLIATGEIVVVDQDYAVRVTQILDPQDAIA